MSVLNLEQWQAVVKEVEKYQPETIIIARYQRFPGLYSKDNRMVYKDHVLTMKKEDNEASVYHEYIDE